MDADSSSYVKLVLNSREQKSNMACSRSSSSSSSSISSSSSSSSSSSILYLFVFLLDKPVLLTEVGCTTQPLSLITQVKGKPRAIMAYLSVLNRSP